MKSAASDAKKQGGCYASEHLMRLKWRRVAGREQEKTDSELLEEFVKTLPDGMILRHHDAGDICMPIDGEDMEGLIKAKAPAKLDSFEA